MSCSYLIYLNIMYFNPRIETWLYKITNTNSPEFKSDLHASNGIRANKNGYQTIADEEQSHSEGDEKKPLSTSEEDGGEKEPQKGRCIILLGIGNDQKLSFNNRNRFEGLFLGA